MQLRTISHPKKRAATKNFQLAVIVIINNQINT